VGLIPEIEYITNYVTEKINEGENIYKNRAAHSLVACLMGFGAPYALF
jgi:hypothetical protein